jgi:hypothetical protein
MGKVGRKIGAPSSLSATGPCRHPPSPNQNGLRPATVHVGRRDDSVPFVIPPVLIQPKDQTQIKPIRARSVPPLGYCSAAKASSANNSELDGRQE